jgi:hypothetical protein
LSFEALPAAAAKPKNYDTWNRAFATWLFRMQKVELFRSPGLKQVSKSGESERDFRIRLQQAGREARDELKAKLQAKYGPKLDALAQRKMKAEQRRAVEKEQSSTQMISTAVTIGAGLLGALMGRKTISATNINRMSQAARSAGRTMKEQSDVGRADESVQGIDQQIADLNAQFEAEVAALDTKVDPTTEVFETVTVRPKKTGITVRLVGLGWKA